MSEPVWQKNLRDGLLLNPLVLVHGNVKDLFRVSPDKQHQLPEEMQNCCYVPFPTWLAIELEHMQFPVISLYDSVDGCVLLRESMVLPFTNLARGAITDTKVEPPESTGVELPRSNPDEPQDNNNWMLPLDVKQDPCDFFRTLYDNVLHQTSTPVAVIGRFVDRFLSFTDRQDSNERQLSTLIQKAAMSIPQAIEGHQLSSRIVLLFDLEGSVPQELNLQAPFSHSVRIPSPSLEDREMFFKENCQLFYSRPHERFDPEDGESLRYLANLTDGLSMQDLFALSNLSMEEQVGIDRHQFKQLLNRFKFGTVENAWQKIKDSTLRDAHAFLSDRVKGQNDVLEEVVPTLIRAKLGLSDLSGKSHSGKPRGVFFFVGPTGVGKTELSKAIAELIFGDEQAMIRFDMNEYSEEHQQARLIGAPPGYVGFDQGGQLANAILERPFSVVLFDEIEKAHGRILDKFLQILDDGRLTDGMGRTVYFSESIIIFTSNLGTAPRRFTSSTLGAATRELSEVAPSEEIYSRLTQLDYPELAKHFRQAVRDFFVNQLGRPESILNRIGEDNILVFQFLQDESVKDAIIQKQVRELQNALHQKYKVDIELTPGFILLLKVHPSGFARNGARGVRNLLSKFVVDRLAMDIFEDPNAAAGQTLIVDYAAKEDQIHGEPFERRRLKHRWSST